MALSNGCDTSIPSTATVPEVSTTAESSAHAEGLHPFGLYLLTLSWAPNFCRSHDHARTEECRLLPGTYGADHLTLHGLWPEYTDEEIRRHHPPHETPWPQFCGKYAVCCDGHDRCTDPLCRRVPDGIPEGMARFAPGYATDGHELAIHEWVKHGSCTGLTSGAYFAAALGTMQTWGGGGWTPAILHDHVGDSISHSELVSALRKTVDGMAPEDSVFLSCDRCRLKEVTVCFDHDADNVPRRPVTCPEHFVKKAQRACRCDEVQIEAYDGVE